MAEPASVPVNAPDPQSQASQAPLEGSGGRHEGLSSTRTNETQPLYGGLGHTPHPLPPPPPPFFYPPQEPPENAASSGIAQGVTLFSMGSVVGLTAVAALRWLNGDDFYLWPSADDLETRQELRHRLDQCSTDQTHRTGTTRSDDGQQEYLLQQIQNIQLNLEVQKEQQALILQQVRSHDSRAITNDSMNVLKHSSQNVSDARMIEQLNRIQDELVGLRSELRQLKQAEEDEATTRQFFHESWEAKLHRTTEQLQICLETIVAASTLRSHEKMASSITGEQKHGANEGAVGSSVDVLAAGAAGDADFEQGTHGAGSSDTEDKIFASPASVQKLIEAVRLLATENEPSELRSGAQMLYLYVFNLSTHPRIPRYRKIFTSNESFQKVNRLKGARELLAAVGFLEKKGAMEWMAQGESNVDERSEDQYIYLLEKASAALSRLKQPSETVDLALDAVSAMNLNPVSDADSVSVPLTPAADEKTNTGTPSFDEEGFAPPPPPPTISDVFKTPDVGCIASPPAIKHSHASDSFQFDYETPLKHPASTSHLALSSHLDDGQADTTGGLSTFSGDDDNETPLSSDREFVSKFLSESSKMDSTSDD